MGWRIGVDIGGTFTDVAVLDEASGRAGIAKVSTTPSDFGAAVIEGTRTAMDEYHIGPDSVTLLSHATTMLESGPGHSESGSFSRARLSWRAGFPAARSGPPGAPRRMTVLDRIALEPAAAAEALREGAPEVSRLWDALAAGDLDAVCIGRATPPPPFVSSGPRCLLPGSFNPVHEGHRRMLATGAARLGSGSCTDASTGAEFELAIVNPDKPPLSPEDTSARLARFAGDEAVWLTRAPTFPEKARIFPGATFAVGVDTIARIAEPRYYGGPEGLASAIALLGRCRFLVFGRRAGTGFATLASISLPAALRALCSGVSEAEFRADISSTELRRTRDERSEGQACGMLRQ